MIRRRWNGSPMTEPIYDDVRVTWTHHDGNVQICCERTDEKCTTCGTLVIDHESECGSRDIRPIVESADGPLCEACAAPRQCDSCGGVDCTDCEGETEVVTYRGPGWKYRSRELITKSRLSAWRKCHYYHHLRYNLGWRPDRDGEALTFGRLVHKGIETLRSKDWDVSSALDAMRFSGPRTDPFIMAKAIELVRAYSWFYVTDRARYRMAAVEVPFQTQLINLDTGRESRTFDLGGVIDAIFEDGPDRRWLVETKTTSEDISGEHSAYFDRLSLDTQITVYWCGMSSLGSEPTGILYDVCKRPAFRPLTATPEASRKYRKTDGAIYANQREHDETPDEFAVRVREAIEAEPESYFRRVEITRLGHQIADGLRDIWHEAREIRDAQSFGRHVKNPDACHQFGTCAFWEHCSSGVELEGNPRFVRSDDPHPEITEAKV